MALPKIEVPTFAVDMEKDEFIGKAALTGKKGKQSKRLVTIALTSDDAPLPTKATLRQGAIFGWD